MRGGGGGGIENWRHFSTTELSLISVHSQTRVVTHRRRGKFPEGYRLRGGPSDRNFAAARSVGSVNGGLADLSAQPEVGDLADQLGVDQHVPRRKVSGINLFITR